ncbi:hypothetical protein [Dongshaea marina]|uniref:hypothetical protein n=1 Tax=Dongshaea marina TaxID=2047966 RepID=UPI000D3E2172|nr:hypothetical protein [Dongshaea marina]
MQKRWLFVTLLFSSLIGAACLCVFSFFHKLVVGFDPFLWESYIAHAWFGGFIGFITGGVFFRGYALKKQLEVRVEELEVLLPICASCKKIRKADCAPEDMSSWVDVEQYITDKTRTEFTHSLCPECQRELSMGRNRGGLH